MTLLTNRASRDPISSADINAIADAVNAAISNSVSAAYHGVADGASAATNNAGILAAIAALPGGVGVVKLPAGILTTSVQFTLAERQVLEGVGGHADDVGRDTEKAATTIVSSFDGSVIQFVPGDNAMGLRHLMIYGDTSKTNQTLVDMGQAVGATTGRPFMEDVELKYAGLDCLRLRGWVLNGDFERVYCLGAKRYNLHATGAHNNAHHFRKCQFREADQWGIRWENGGVNTFDACTLESNSRDSAVNYGAAWFGGGSAPGGIGVVWNGVYLENNGGDAVGTGTSVKFEKATGGEIGRSFFTEIGTLYAEGPENPNPNGPVSIEGGSFVSIGIQTSLAPHAIIGAGIEAAMFIQPSATAGAAVIPFTITDNSNLAMVFGGEGGSGADAGGWYATSGRMRTDAGVDISRAAGGDAGLTVRVNGDAFSRVHVAPNGEVQIGPGNIAGDVILSRNAANVLSIRDAFALPNTMAAASAPNNSVFRDSADNIIKIKDNGGVVRLLY